MSVGGEYPVNVHECWGVLCESGGIICMYMSMGAPRECICMCVEVCDVSVYTIVHPSLAPPAQNKHMYRFISTTAYPPQHTPYPLHHTHPITPQTQDVGLIFLSSMATHVAALGTAAALPSVEIVGTTLVTCLLATLLVGVCTILVGTCGWCGWWGV